jgi:hypothetical protein
VNRSRPEKQGKGFQAKKQTLPKVFVCLFLMDKTKWAICRLFFTSLINKTTANMTSDSFWIYLQLGFEHLTDWQQGYDHLLFIAALAALYDWKAWKKVVGLVTAFTLGHSLTLLLAGLGIIPFSADWVEFLIPITILLTALWNLGGLVGKKTESHFTLTYALTTTFGLIHGLGFANTARALIGKAQSLWVAILGFNIGVEMGQLLIVAVLFALVGIWTQVLKLDKKIWAAALSLLVAVLSAQLVWERAAFLAEEGAEYLFLTLTVVD